MELNEKITLTDIRTDVNKVLEYLDNTFFTDSTVMMSNDEYIKNTVIERLSQVVLFSENIATLNEDASELSKAMLRSSLSDKDINIILNSSLKISGISVTVKNAASQADDLKSDDEETVEKANEMIKAKMESMGSVESLIGIIKDCIGTSRILPEASQEAVFEEISQNLEPEKAIKDLIKVERPVAFNLAYIDLNKIDNSQIFSFLNNMLAIDSNSSLTMEFPLDALVDDLKTLYTIDLPNIANAAVEFARKSAKNSFKFIAEPDAFASLFDTL